MMCLTRVDKKKLLVRHNKVTKWLFNYFLKNTEAATGRLLLKIWEVAHVDSTEILERGSNYKVKS